jgi:hypothetical protein
MNTAIEVSSIQRAMAIVVQVHPAMLEHEQREQLLVQVNAVRAVTPDTPVLVTLGQDEHALTPHEAGSVLVLVAQLAPASLDATLVLDECGRYHVCHGQSARVQWPLTCWQH